MCSNQCGLKCMSRSQVTVKESEFPYSKQFRAEEKGKDS